MPADMPGEKAFSIFKPKIAKMALALNRINRGENSLNDALS